MELSVSGDTIRRFIKETSLEDREMALGRSVSCYCRTLVWLPVPSAGGSQPSIIPIIGHQMPSSGF